jgi:hypothetical protein
MVFKILTAAPRGRPARLVLAGAVATALLGSSLALAAEGDPEVPEVTETTVTIEELPAEELLEPAPPIEYRAEDNVIVFSLPDAEGMFLDCSEAVVTVEPDATTTDVEGCLAAETLGPNGQTNHGQVVSAYVHAVKASGYEGPLGHLVRNAAKSDFGKEPLVEALDPESAPSTEDGGKARARGKKDKSGKAKGKS